MVITHVVSEIKKHYDLSNEKSIVHIIQNIVDDFNSSDNSYSADSYSMEQIPVVEDGRRTNGYIELSKGLTIAL